MSSNRDCAFFFPFKGSSGAVHLALRQAQYPSGDPSSGSKPALALLHRGRVDAGALGSCV